MDYLLVHALALAVVRETKSFHRDTLYEIAQILRLFVLLTAFYQLSEILDIIAIVCSVVKRTRIKTIMLPVTFDNTFLIHLFNWKVSLPALFCIYSSYYLMYVIHRPKLICGEGRLRQFIEERLPGIRTSYYYPTYWAPGGHLQTLLRAVFQMLPPIRYIREIVPMPDGGEVALDWIDDNKDTYRGLVVILPGLTGGSQSSYSQSLAYQAKLFGCRTVVYNNRGCGNSALKTPNFACAASTDDLYHVLKFLKTRYPDLPLIAAGVSLGGIMLSNYLANDNITEKYVSLGFAASIAWNFHKSTISLDKPFNRIIYNRYLGKNLVKLAKNNHEMFLKHRDQLPFDLDDVRKCTTIAEFDTYVTAPLCGYKSVEDYYTDASFVFKMHRVKTPIVFLNAPDDPFSPLSAIPIEDIPKNPNLALILTKTGGHIGFMEGLLPTRQTYMDRFFAQLLKSYLDHSSELKKMD